MRRRLFTLIRVTSLALLLGTAAVWVRSYSVVESLTLVRRFGDPDAPGHGYTWVSISWLIGTISVTGGKVVDRLPADERWVTWGGFPASNLARAESPWLKFRSSYAADQTPRGWSRGTIVWQWRATAPCWAAALGASILPAGWGLRKFADLRGARWAARGRCGRCGYDLRESAGRCPECGTQARTTEPAVTV